MQRFQAARKANNLQLFRRQGSHAKGPTACINALIARFFLDFKDRPCWHCDRTSHLSKDCPNRKAIKACRDAPPAGTISAVGPSRPLAAASAVGQGRFSGFWVVVEGPEMDAAIKEAKDET